MPKSAGPFDPATYRRDKAIGYVPPGITDPKGQPNPKGTILTYKDLCGRDNKVDLAKMEAFKQYITIPEGEAIWITPQTMGAPFESGSAQEMLNEYAVRKGIDPETCLKQLVISVYATDLYNQGLRNARPLKSGKPKADQTRTKIVNAFKSKHPAWATLSLEDQTRLVMEYINQK